MGAQESERGTTQVSGSSQPAMFSSQRAQQSSYVPPHPNIQATQAFFDSAPTTEPPPASVAQGYSVGPINTTQPLYCPAQQVMPQLQIVSSKLLTIVPKANMKI